MNEEELVNLASSLSKDFHNLDEFIEYKKLKKAIEKNKRLNYLSSEIEKKKKSLPLLGKKVQLQTLIEIKKLKDEYDSHPLVVNFNQVKAQLVESLKPLTDLKI